MENYRKLPTKWIILDVDGRILSEDISDESVVKVSKDIVENNKNYFYDKKARFILAKCHYRIGKDNGREYYTSLEEIPEALKCFPNRDLLSRCLIRQIYHYGVKQLEV